MKRSSRSMQIGITALLSSAGLATASGDNPVDHRSDESLMRVIELNALAGPVHTSQALPMPANRARLSRVTVHDGDQRSSGQVWGLDVIDGQPDTSITVHDGGRSAIELSFIGAPRWISHLLVDTDAELVSVEYQDLAGKWRPFGFGPGGQPIEGELVKALGFRIVPVSSARADGVVEINEIDAWMQQEDTDDGAVYGLSSAAVPEFFYEWCETYSGTPLSKCSEECEGLADELDGWHIKGFGNNSSWERDFRRSAMGGTENTYVDANDLSYFAGHGSSSWDSTWSRSARNLLFSNTTKDDSAHVPGDSYDSWGDVDMEWMCFAACQLMRDDGYWAASMDGIHLIMGWHTNMRDVTMGIDFGNRAIGTTIFDPARRVLDSWLWAAEKNHGSGYTAKVVGETTSMGNDYLWGEGFVNPDPFDDGTYTLWTYSTGSITVSDPAAPHAPGDRAGGLELASDRGDTEEMVTLKGKGPRAVEILIPERLMRQHRGQPLMKVYEQLAPAVNAGYVAGIADQLCQTMGLFCNPDIGPTKDQGEFIATDGVWELRVNALNGGFELTDTSIFAVPVEKAPQLMDQGQATELVMFELGSAGLLPQDAQLTGVDSFMQGLGSDAVNGGGAPQPLPMVLEPVHHRVQFRRSVDSFSVAGPSGEMMAMVGENGIAQVQQNSWMTPNAIGEVTTTPIEDILNALSKDPAAVAINGIPLVAESIQVLDVELGYFESVVPLGNGTVMQYLRPAYALQCMVTERAGPGGNPAPSLLEINAWADFEKPIVQVVCDNQGQCVEYGQTVCCDLVVQGGEPPYTYSWSDEVSGVVSTSDKACFTLAPLPDPGNAGGDETVLMPSEKQTSETTRTVEVTVTDFFGTSTTVTVEIPVCPPFDCPADLNNDGFLDSGDIGLFVELFLAGNSAVDFNNDGFIDSGDISLFVEMFLAGC